MLTPLRVLFAGHPDNGKSTLIGRLLVHNDSVYTDERQADLSHYTDGLQDEQAQGRTIDVAYRTLILRSGYRMIAIDTPGHTEFISNFLSGLTYADIVLHLIDSTRPHLVSPHLDMAHRVGVPIMNVFTKCEHPDTHPMAGRRGFKVDSVTGMNIDPLSRILTSLAEVNGDVRTNLAHYYQKEYSE